MSDKNFNVNRAKAVACSMAAVCGVFLFVALFAGSFWGIHVVAAFVVLCAVAVIWQADSETHIGDYAFAAGFLATAAIWWTIDVKWPLYIAMLIIGIGLHAALSDETDTDESEA